MTPAVAVKATTGGVAGTRSPVNTGTEVANSAAATLKIAREPPPSREDDMPRKFALGGPPEVADSIQEVKVRTADVGTLFSPTALS